MFIDLIKVKADPMFSYLKDSKYVPIKEVADSLVHMVYVDLLDVKYFSVPHGEDKTFEIITSSQTLDISSGDFIRFRDKIMEVRFKEFLPNA